MHAAFEEGVVKLSELIKEGQESGEIVSVSDSRCLAKIAMYTLVGLKQAIIFGTDTAVLKNRWNGMTKLLFFTEETSGE